MAIRFGIAIPTFGDSAIRLEALLHSLDKFTQHGRRDMTILVCDDATPDGGHVEAQREVCKKWTDKFKHGVGHIQRDEWGHISGCFDTLGREMDADIIMYLADDTIVSDNWLMPIDWMYRENPALSIGIVSPTYVEAWELTINDILSHEHRFYDIEEWEKERTQTCPWNTGRIMRNDLVFEERKFDQYQREQRLRMTDFSPVLGTADDGRCDLYAPWPMDGGIGPCFSIRKHVFEEVNGFANMPCGDFECIIGWRAWDAGYICCAVYSPTIFHARGFASTECDQVLDPMNTPELKKYRWGTPESREYFKEHCNMGFDLSKVGPDEYFPTIQQNYIKKYITEENHETLRTSAFLKYGGHRPSVSKYYRRLDEIKHPAISHNDPANQARLEWLVQRCEGDVLDIGCGNGQLLSRLQRGKHCGVDLDRRYIETAKENIKCDVDLYVLDAACGVPDSCGRDTIVLADVLEHLSFNDAKALVLRAWDLAKVNVLITLPWSDEMIDNIDHAWGPTDKKVGVLADLLNQKGGNCSMQPDENFMYIEARKDGTRRGQ